MSFDEAGLYYISLCTQASTCSPLGARVLIRACYGCDGILNSDKVFDSCGVCGGGNTACSTPVSLSLSLPVPFCYGLSARLRWTAPYNHSRNDSIVLSMNGQQYLPAYNPPTSTYNGTVIVSNCSTSVPSSSICLPRGPGLVILRYVLGDRAADTVGAAVNFTLDDKVVDECGVCGGNGLSCAGCDGVPNSGKTLDACGVCGGDGKSCAGCDGVPKSGKVFDACGVCGGDNATCAGCDGVPNSGKKLDDCGVCGGAGGCTAQLNLWSDNRMCVYSRRMELRWQVAVNSTSFRFTIRSPVPLLMATCSFVSFPLSSSTGICLIDSFEGDEAVVSGPCSCTTKKDFNVVGTGAIYKIEAYLNTAPPAKFVFDNIAVGPKADACGVCGGDNATCAGCDGVPNSGKVYDSCIVCGGDNACVGCDDIPFSGKKRDACGVCGGNNATCAGCDGVPNSGKVYDQCGICGGDGHLCVLDYKLTASRNSFCDGLDLLVQWTAPINHTEFDSVVFFSKTNNSIIDQYFLPRLQYQGDLVLTSSKTSRDTFIYVPPGWSNVLYISLSYDLSPVPVGLDIGPVTFNSRQSSDVCGVCGGDGKSCLGCDGVPFSGKVIDACGICGGDGSSCSGCDTPGSGKIRDDCGVCNGKGGCVPFTLAAADKTSFCNLKSFALAFTASLPRLRTRVAILNSTSVSSDPSYVAAIDLPPSIVTGTLAFDTPWTRLSSLTSDPWSDVLLPSYLPAGKYQALVFVTGSAAAANSTTFEVRGVDVCGVCGGDGSSCAKAPPSVIEEILAQYSTGQLVGFGFGGLFGLIVLGYLVYKIVDCCKRQRTLNRLQSHYQLRDPGAGLHPSATRKSAGQSGVVTSPVSVRMQPLNEQGSLTRSPSNNDDQFAALNPLSRRGAGGAAAAGASRSQMAPRGGKESPDAIEMQLTAGGRVSGGAAAAQLQDDDFSDFVGAADESAAETVVELSPTAVPAFRPAPTRVAIGDVAGALSAPPVSRAGSGGAAAKSAGSVTADVLSPLRSLDRSPAGTIAGPPQKRDSHASVALSPQDDGDFRPPPPRGPPPQASHALPPNSELPQDVALSPILQGTVSPDPPEVSLQAASQRLRAFEFLILLAQLPSSSSFRPVESSGARRASLPGLPGSSIGPDALSLSIKVCEDDVIRVTMEAQLSQDVLLGEEKALVTFVCMANSDDVVEDVSIRLALAKGMTSSMGAPSSTTLSPHEDSITQVFMLTAKGKITKKGIVKFKIKLEYSVKGEKHFKEMEMKNLWSLATGGEGSERVALNSSL